MANDDIARRLEALEEAVGLRGRPARVDTRTPEERRRQENFRKDCDRRDELERLRYSKSSFEGG